MRLRFCLSLFFLALLGGCGEQISAYRLIGHDPAKAKKILVLPFLDTRTFKDPRDPHIDTAREKTREIFISVMRKMPAFQDKEIVALPAARDCHSIAADRVLAIGRQHGADLVITGQIFSFTETRAASIPPRAGLFVRIFSVPDGKLVFVGDDYRAAAGPGARGGREAQAELAAQAILNEYAAITTPARRERRLLKTEINLSAEDAVKVLLLPFHERPNPDNLIEHTGGGEVVTSLFEMELAKEGKVRLIYPPDEVGGHDRLLMPSEALELAKKLGADYVLRGQVIEFRRAMSVPSWYSAIISVAILAAQVMFAEVSGVDIAIEIWRAADGACVFARRNTEIQKYVVQAEKTVRAIAAATVPLIKQAITAKDAPAVAPIIDSIVLKPRTPAQPAAKEETAAAKEAEGEEKKPATTAEGAEEKEDTAESPPTPKENEASAPPEEKESKEAPAKSADQATAAEAGGNNKPPEKKEERPAEVKTGDSKAETPAPADKSQDQAMNGEPHGKTKDTAPESAPEK